MYVKQYDHYYFYYYYWVVLSPYIMGVRILLENIISCVEKWDSLLAVYVKISIPVHSRRREFVVKEKSFHFSLEL